MNEFLRGAFSLYNGLMLRKILGWIRENIFLVLIVLIAFSLRFVQVSSNPPSLNWDEVSHGYNAYSILKTGKDEWGVRLPIIFRAYGDYKLPVYIYFTVLSEFLLGLNPLAVRLPSILAGTLSVVFVYLLVKQLKLFSGKKQNQLLALFSALLFSVEPWNLFLSRVAVEANLALFFIISGVYFLLLGLEKKNWFKILGLFFLGLSVWTYNSARIFVPLLLICFLLICWSDILGFWKKKKVLSLFSLIVFLFFFVPMVYQLVNPIGQARYSWVQILDQGLISRIIENRNNSPLPGLLPRLIHNKATYFLKVFLLNYLAHYSPNFLFFEGAGHYQFSLPGQGLLFLLNLPFFLLGLIFLVKEWKGRKNVSLLFSWFLLAPVASSLTREAPHALRDIIFLPMPMVISGYGLIKVLSWIKDRYQILLIVLYLILLFGFTESYLRNYFGEYRQNYSWSWQYGYQQVVDFVNQNDDLYEKMIVTKKYGEPHEFFLFFGAASQMNWADPEYYQSPCNGLNRFFQSDWYWVDSFDRFYFVNDWDIPEQGSNFVLESGEEVNCSYPGECLLITSPGNVPAGWKKIKTINFLNDQPAFELYVN